MCLIVGERAPRGRRNFGKIRNHLADKDLNFTYALTMVNDVTYREIPGIFLQICTKRQDLQKKRPGYLIRINFIHINLPGPTQGDMRPAHAGSQE